MEEPRADNSLCDKRLNRCPTGKVGQHLTVNKVHEANSLEKVLSTSSLAGCTVQIALVRALLLTEMLTKQQTISLNIKGSLSPQVVGAMYTLHPATVEAVLHHRTAKRASLTGRHSENLVGIALREAYSEPFPIVVIHAKHPLTH